MQAGLSQQLNMSPRLLQSIRFLRLSAAELDEEVRSALDENLMLDADEGSGDEAVPVQTVDAAEPQADRWEAGAQDNWASGGTAGADYEAVAYVASTDTRSIRQTVLQQFAMNCRDIDAFRLAEAIVDEVDDAGYLVESLDSICERTGTERPAAEQVLWQLQRLEPAGYAARSLRECLSVQLESLPFATPGHALAQRIVSECLELLGEHDYRALAAQLDCTQAELRQAERVILSLDAKPGQETIPDQQLHVVPEIRVRRHDEQWRVEPIGAGRPAVRVNPVYEQLVEGGGAGDAQGSLREQLSEARWLIRGLEMRQDTLLRAAEFIFERQRGFLENGDEGMQPLTLQEVADAIGMHESTISRITTNKYAQTPRGVFELKHFFSARIRQGGTASVAGTAVRAMVRKLIEREDSARPMCDGTIAALLSRRGVKVARRTVAKYRESLNIAPARQRRQVSAAHA